MFRPKRIAKEIATLTPTREERRACVVFDRSKQVGKIPADLLARYQLDSNGECAPRSGVRPWQGRLLRFEREIGGQIGWAASKSSRCLISHFAASRTSTATKAPAKPRGIQGHQRRMSSICRSLDEGGVSGSCVNSSDCCLEH